MERMDSWIEKLFDKRWEKLIDNEKSESSNKEGYDDSKWIDDYDENESWKRIRKWWYAGHVIPAPRGIGGKVFGFVVG